MNYRTALRNAKRRLSKCTNDEISWYLSLKLRVQRLEAATVMEPLFPRFFINAFLRVKYHEHALEVLEHRLKELDTIAVGSLGQPLGLKPTTPCNVVEDQNERRRLRHQALGERPPKMHVCHKCDVPKCVAADHLFWGSMVDNMRDCAIKGRRGRKPLYASPEGYVAATREKLLARKLKLEQALERAKSRYIQMII